jgi:tetratricopeptide (TPR) repeat protein
MFGSWLAIVHRAFSLLLVSVAPFAAPLEIGDPNSNHERTIRYATGAFLAIVVIAVASAVWRRSRTSSMLVGLTLVSAIVLACVFRGSSGPLARGIWFESPIEWCAIAAVSQATFLRRVFPKTWQPYVAGALLSAFTLVAALPRISSRTAMWRAIAARNPGNEAASMHAGAALKAQGDGKGALDVWSACVQANPGACRCACSAIELYLFDGKVASATDSLESSYPNCKDDSAFGGMRAEALLKSGRTMQAIVQAEEVIIKSPHDPHALFVKSLTLLAQGNYDAAMQAAVDARDSNVLGIDGVVALDRVWIAKGEYDKARADLQRLVQTYPNAAIVEFLLAQIDDKRDNFHDARESYLTCLRIDPKFADARYALAILTLRHGIKSEAKHNLDELAIIAPDDPRIPELRMMIDAP